uniref:Uncharacterized protein n=1 Tax=Cyprinus carpio TaxID=7962 RepID=A0A8C1XAV0_CYPCA
TTLRQKGSEVGGLAQLFWTMAEGMGYNDEALKDLFNACLDNPVPEWEMNKLEILDFWGFTIYLQHRSQWDTPATPVSPAQRHCARWPPAQRHCARWPPAQRHCARWPPAQRHCARWPPAQRHVPADFTESSQVPLVPPGCSQVPVVPPESSQVPLVPPGCSQVPVVPPAPRQVPMDPPESGQVTINTHEASKITVRPPESSPVTLDLYGQGQVTRDLHESSPFHLRHPGGLQFHLLHPGFLPCRLCPGTLNFPFPPGLVVLFLFFSLPVSVSLYGPGPPSRPLILHQSTSLLVSVYLGLFLWSMEHLVAAP